MGSVKLNGQHFGQLIPYAISVTVRTVLATNIKSLMEYKGMASRAFAVHCGISKGTVGTITKASNAADIDTLEAIAEACHLQPWQLLVPGLDPKQPPVITQLTESERRLYSRIAKAMESEKAER